MSKKKRVWVNKNHKRNPVCQCDRSIGENCEGCYPATPRLVRRNETPDISDSIPVESIEVWVYHPDVMSRIGENTLLHGTVYKITKFGLEPYC
jgi:hypothetical protein